MRISKLQIENIRGIDSQEYELNIPSNNPIILVAPNGYGKTSIATAFSSLTSQKLVVQEADLYKNDLSKTPKITLTDESGNIFYADETANTISNEYGVFTIRGQIKPKATNVSFGGFSRAKPSLVVDPIVLYKNIPPKKEFVYSYTNIKEKFGPSASKLLINLSSKLKDPILVLFLTRCKQDFLSLLQIRNGKSFENFFTEMNSYSESKKDLIKKTYTTIFKIEKIPQIIKILSKINNYFPELSLVEKIINIYQLALVIKTNESSINNINKYYTFIADKNEINNMLELLNCTWKSIKASQKKGSFIIEFPRADQISNGERDILCFVGHLFEAKKHLNKQKCILIIDEIFDYLDDANLIAAQYFLIKFINLFKNTGRELYPILLTHLDPLYFNTYSFSTKNVVYLNKIPTHSNKYRINNLLKDRDNCKKNNKPVYDTISNNYLHYCEDTTDAKDYLISLGVDNALYTPESFRNASFAELNNYKTDSPYDIALVCCGIRITIEQKAYSQLSPEQKSIFSTCHKKTIDKLSYAKTCGAKIPETHFLLSIIYNECMHLDSQCKRLRQIHCKLNNKVIKNMIRNL